MYSLCSPHGNLVSSVIQEDGKRLTVCIEEAQEEVQYATLMHSVTNLTSHTSQIMQMKSDMAKRAERAKMQDTKYREMPDIVVKVNCKYRAELFFKISRKTKLSRLFNAWTERMESGVAPLGKSKAGEKNGAAAVNGIDKAGSATTPGSMQFVFTHAGRVLEAHQTPEEAGMEDGDEILSVEMMDLTEGPGTEELVSTVLA